MSRLRPELPINLVPDRSWYDLAVEPELLDSVEQELREKATSTEDGAYGYYPREETTDRDLPAAVSFADTLPQIVHRDHPYEFDWVKYSVGNMPRGDSYHLDINRSTGLGYGEVDENNIPTQHITRLLLNLHTSSVRRLSYLNVAVEALRWEMSDEGFVQIHPYEMEELNFGYKSSLIMPRRIGQAACIAEICVSHVAHSARETDEGHFLASYSRVESLG